MFKNIITQEIIIRCIFLSFLNMMLYVNFPGKQSETSKAELLEMVTGAQF